MPWKKSIKYNQHEQYEEVDQSSWGKEELERGITEENERMIWKRCSVCNHPLRDEIENAWLKKGRNAYMSVRQLSKNYGMSPTSIDRHMSRHVWVDLETREKITDEEYFQDVHDERSYIDPDRPEVIKAYEAWQEAKIKKEEKEENDL